MKFIETSAKTSSNVGESFVSMTTDIIKNIKEKQVDQVKEKIDINPKAKDITKGGKKCC